MRENGPCQKHNAALWQEIGERLLISLSKKMPTIPERLQRLLDKLDPRGVIMPIDVSLSTRLSRGIFQSLLVALLVLPSSFVSAQGRSRSDQTVSVGPWEISTAYRADKFENCTLSRTFESLDVTFVRGSDGLSLVLSDPKWKLERGQSYPVHLLAGPQSFQGKAVAEGKSVTIAVPDRQLAPTLRLANALEVRGEGKTIRISLDKSAAALERLDGCYDKNARDNAETNPFVAPSRKP